MRELRRIDVLLNRETDERFNEGDIVKVTTKGTYGTEYVGRIEDIATSELTLDMSRKYKSYSDRLKYEDILKIEKIKEE
ncbi:hypothetical protein ACR77J_07425 [Tissierella praeacuta]|uniref:hypothetical protein n=1 Tax=Tissierella praeacuta TaxID=43131 RepID=UPI003DA53863